jgi:hypothetical protein
MTREQLLKIAKGAGIAFLAAGLVAALQSMTGVDFGPTWNPIVQALIGVAINAVKVYAKY